MKILPILLLRLINYKPPYGVQAKFVCIYFFCNLNEINEFFLKKNKFFIMNLLSVMLTICTHVANFCHDLLSSNSMKL